MSVGTDPSPTTDASDPRAWLGRATHLMRSGRLQDAVFTLLVVPPAATPRDRAFAQCLLASCFLERRDLERAAAAVSDSERLAEQAHPPLNDPRLCAEQALLRVRIGLAHGETHGLVAVLDQARTQSALFHDPRFRVQLLRAEAQLLLAEGHPEAARAPLAEALEEAEQCGDPIETAMTLAALADLATRDGAFRRAQELLLRAATLLEEAGSLFLYGQVALQLGVLLGKQSLRAGTGRSEAAASWLAKAQEVFRTVGTAEDMTRVRLAFTRYGRRRTDRIPREEASYLLAEMQRARSDIAQEQAASQVAILKLAAPLLAQADIESLIGILATHEQGLTQKLKALAALDERFLNLVNELAVEREQIRSLLDMTTRLASIRSPSRLLEEAAMMAAKLTGADRVVIAEEWSGTLVPRATLRFDKADDAWKTVLRQAIATGQAVFASVATESRSGIPASQVRHSHALGVPFGSGGRTRGGIWADKGLSGGTFTENDVELLMLFGSHLCSLLENALLSAQEEIESEEKRATLDAIQEAVITTDREGRLTTWNAVAADILGIRPGTEMSLRDIPQLAPLLQHIREGRADVDAEVVTLGRVDYIAQMRMVRASDGMLLRCVITLARREQAQRWAQKLLGPLPRFSFNDVVAISPATQEVLARAKSAALTESNVLLTGESGTGKEVFAQAIHNASSRKTGPFVAINCAAIPRELLESELFGYEGGAFTDAKHSGQPGKCELAQGGTLVLDEIGDMPPEMQAKLLRVLQERSVTRLGSARSIPLDVRVIATTNADLAGLVARGRFRNDLYYRLCVIHIHLPPLRERREDILPLASRFLEQLCARLGRPIVRLAPHVAEAFQNYHWPGNIRELQHVLEAEVSLIPPGDTMITRIPPGFERRRFPRQATGVPLIFPDAATLLEEPDEAGREELVELLRATRGDTAEIARRLRVSRATVYNRLTRYGLRPRDFRKQ